MRSVDWPLPSVIAGSLRTALGKLAGKGDFSSETARQLLQVTVAGVFPTVDGQLHLPVPHDCIVHPTEGPLRATPQTIEYGGGGWPHPSLRPVMLSHSDAEEDFKPKNAPAWWPWKQYVKWLLKEPVAFNSTFLHAPEQEVRVHVVLQPETGAADDGQLFSTAALPLSHLARHDISENQPFGERFAAIKLATRVEAEGWCSEHIGQLNGHQPTGGERRLVHWKAEGTHASLWDCPERIRTELSSTKKVRMILATPAIFEEGWKPGWLDQDLEGSPPGSDVPLKLVGLTIPRWRAVSGWSLAKVNDRGELDPNGTPGPKPVRRIVPAGGVYFFNVAGSAANLADHWLRPVSDSEQDQRDGFGLATWGIW